MSWLNGFAGKSKDIQNPNGSGIVRFGYVRAISGNLDLRASTWRAGASTGSTPTPTPTPTPTASPTPSPDPGAPAPAPKLTSLRAAQSGDTYTAADEALPVFTPNGDGTGDALTMHYKATSPAKLRVTVTNASDAVVRTFSVAGRKGSSTFGWNGRTNAGGVAPDGTYIVRVRITGGNSRSIQVKLLTTIKVPRSSRALLDASDGDSLAATATQSVAVHSTARLLWRVLDSHGEVVRTGMDNVRVTKGTQGWVWDGRDDSGVYVPDGTYTSMVTATTSRGSYSHQVIVRVMAYGVTGDFHQRPGQWNTFSIQAAESQAATPRLTVKQPGLSSYRLRLKQVSKNRWSAVWKGRPGRAGRVTFSISGTDIKGGEDSRSWTGTIQ